MDNLTHSLVGLAAAKAGLEKLSPRATTLCVLAANSPDADLVALLFGGRWTYLQQHRGISHSIVGVFVLAFALPLAFYLGDMLLARTYKRARTVKLRGLLIASTIATASHPLMDWTNNYGVRFLLPWNPRWFYGDFVFVIDPFMWLVLGSAAFLLTATTKKQLITWIIIALVPSFLVLMGPSGPRFQANEIMLRLVWIAALIVVVNLHRRDIGRRAGAKIAIAALATVAIYCAILAATHAVALRQAKLQATTIANRNAEHVLRVAAMPTIANPIEWMSVMETDRATYRFSVTLLGSPPTTTNILRYEKPDGLAAEAVAQTARDGRSQVFLGFARFPVVRVVGEDCASQTLVQFADLRYTEPGRGRGTFSLDVQVDCPALEKVLNKGTE
jgi:inner membrane protein